MIRDICETVGLFVYAAMVSLFITLTVFVRGCGAQEVEAANVSKPIPGIDALALAKINGGMIAEELGPGSALGLLDGTFGDPYKQLKAALNTGNIIAVRIHLVDGTCIRNGSCAKGSPSYKSFDILQNRARKFSKFMEGYPKVAQYISPFLEQDEKDHAVINQWYAIIKANAPRSIPVCSAFTGWCPPGVQLEKHGNNAKGDITSNDGESHFDSDSDQYRSSGKKITLSWVNENNCRVSGEKTFTPPLQRTDCATRAIVRQQVSVLKTGPPVPTVKGCSVLNGNTIPPEIGKPNAEYYGAAKDDGRGNKLLLILRNKYASGINLFTLVGKAVGHLIYYGPYAGGGYRYYIGGNGASHQTPLQLQKSFGSEWGLGKASGKCWILNAIRRQGLKR